MYVYDEMPVLWVRLQTEIQQDVRGEVFWGCPHDRHSRSAPLRERIEMAIMGFPQMPMLERVPGLGFLDHDHDLLGHHDRTQDFASWPIQ